MKVIFVCVICIISTVLAAAQPKLAAASCPVDACDSGVKPDCYCSGKVSPIEVADTPQFLTLTFTDAVTDLIYNTYLRPILDGRTNPDNERIGVTFYVPHEYTDYERVNDLYNEGYEIAVHTISKSPLQAYWRNASLEVLVDEFKGQKEIIATFANIPSTDIIGARIPALELKGNLNFKAYQQADIQYDNSWTTPSNNRFFPYTLDYQSSQPCMIGTCPTEWFPGSWVLPIVDISGIYGIDCNSLSGCITPESADEIADWLIGQLDRFATTNRAPLTLTVTSAWFLTGEDNWNGFIKFLDSLKSRDEVFLVSHSQLLEWMRNPIPLGNYTTPTYTRNQSCAPIVCPLLKGEEMRYMKSCVACPKVYPWLKNPQGN